MAVSVFDLFKIGIGPSSSHTVGPMRAALMFAQGLERDGLLAATASVKVDLYGSLGATGKGHGTDRGVMLGLMGDAPDTVDPDTIVERLEAVRLSRKLALLGTHEVPFVQKDHISFYRQALPEHPNGLKLRAFDAQGETLRESTYLSVGGGFVVTAGAPNTKVLTRRRSTAAFVSQRQRVARAVRIDRQEHRATDVGQRARLAYGRRDARGLAEDLGRDAIVCIAGLRHQQSGRRR